MYSLILEGMEAICSSRVLGEAGLFSLFCFQILHRKREKEHLLVQHCCIVHNFQASGKGVV